MPFGNLAVSTASCASPSVKLKGYANIVFVPTALYSARVVTMVVSESIRGGGQPVDALVASLFSLMTWEEKRGSMGLRWIGRHHRQ